MKFDFKSMVIGLLIGCTGLTTAYSAANKTITVNDTGSHVMIQEKEISFAEEQKPFVYNEITYAPIRTIAESMGGSVSFREHTNTIEIYSTDKAKVRLLEEAIGNIGTVSPQKAIEIWAKGLKDRSAALQYCVMTEQLKQSYVKSLDENGYDFWITGVSSPWVENYELLKTTEKNNTSFEYDMKFNTKTSEGTYQFFVTVTVVKDGDYWKISDIQGDSDSKNYTGFFKEE